MTTSIKIEFDHSTETIAIFITPAHKGCCAWSGLSPYLALYILLNLFNELEDFTLFAQGFRSPQNPLIDENAHWA